MNPHAPEGFSRDEVVPSTEQPNPASSGIDVKSSREILQIIHGEDLQAWKTVGDALDVMTSVVDQVVESFRSGGRLFYVGAGTSGLRK